MAQRFKAPEVMEAVSPNLIPMIDIMFLMLLFFMLGADMSQRDLEEVMLPQASEIKNEDKDRGVEKRTTVNVAHRLPRGGFSCSVYENHGICREESHWLMAIRGKEYTQDTIAVQLKVEGDLDKEELDPQTGKQLSKRFVMIRADQGAPYGFVQKVIEACAFAGIYKIEVGAAKPPKP